MIKAHYVLSRTKHKKCYNVVIQHFLRNLTNKNKHFDVSKVFEKLRGVFAMKKIIAFVCLLCVSISIMGCSASKTHIFLDGNTEEYLAALNRLDYDDAKRCVEEYIDTINDNTDLTYENRALAELEDAIEICRNDNYEMEYDEFYDSGDLSYTVTGNTALMSMHISGDGKMPYCVVATWGDDFIGLYAVEFKIDDEHMLYGIASDTMYTEVLKNGNCYEGGTTNLLLSDMDIWEKCEETAILRYTGTSGHRDVDISAEIIRDMAKLHNLGIITCNLVDYATPDEDN